MSWVKKEMPLLGDIEYGRDIGHYKGHKFIWLACENCGRERWVLLKKGKPTKRLRAIILKFTLLKWKLMVQESLITKSMMDALLLTM